MSKPYIPNDKLAQKAKKQNYRARSVFKLQELDKKFNLIKKGQNILDVAAAPGSWTQYASKKIQNTGHILAIDIKPIEPIANNVTTKVIDINDHQKVLSELNNLNMKKVDLIISDIAPSTTGIANIDHARSIELNNMIFELAKIVLNNNSKMVLKIFDGKDLNDFIKKLKKHFKKVERYKSKASRERSKELYLICS